MKLTKISTKVIPRVKKLLVIFIISLLKDHKMISSTLSKPISI